ncbi:hypothetical protein QBC33DRAFT_544892 [Phialemonium atrogriseum]|uniref:Uncharacterized protein n=1 Tax=Phialemonium atrogriseum TaxID=1093897 RepID=A0AAJ0BY11_9PEZI|nr:uncharacterized protein QBC33DRAFT_544892 [Phialemonium atrogriseum]KAK1765199.1 hypothetical protein QBC33DRAFT_544892 [Phialemonium atrogriseum]
MSLSLDTVLQVIEIVNKAVEMYQKIQDAPEQMRKIGKRMERLNALLAHLELFLREKKEHALARLRPAQTEELLSIIEDIRDDSSKVQALFYKWNNDIGPFGFQLRFKTLAQAYFALGSSPEKLSGLADDIELHRQDLRDHLQLMGCIGINALLVGGSVGAAAQQNLATPGPTTNAGSGPKLPLSPSPSPSPVASRQDYRVLFVDPTNIARGVVAEALMKLLKEWTLGAGGDWRVKIVHSAGFFVKRGSDVVDTIDSLEFSYPSYRLPMAEGNKKPKEVALAALFDNGAYNFPFKKSVQEHIGAHRSRGLQKDVFKKYDYIMVFTGREHDNMIRLRKALVAKEGKGITQKGKGRIVHLGRYLTLDGIPREIVDAPKDKDGRDSRENWNWKVSQVKIAIKGFLKQEMRWKQPQNSGKSG